MTNLIQDGCILTVAAPSGGVTSGQLVVVDKIIGVATTTAAVGVNVELATEGVFELPKTTTDVVTVGAALYWNSGTSKLTVTPGTGSKPLVGYATKAAGNGATTVYCSVIPNLATGPA